jgi:hypothetical protein
MRVRSRIEFAATELTGRVDRVKHDRSDNTMAKTAVRIELAAQNIETHDQERE